MGLVSKRRREGLTWAERAIANGGMRTGSRVIGYVVDWRYEQAQAGHRLSVEEYIAIAGHTDRTVWRWQADFRQCFPEHQTPADLLAVIDVTHDVDGAQLAL